MNLTDFTCPNCKAIMDLEGATGGDLMDCPQCGKPFEVPIQKEIRPPPPPYPPPQPKPTIPKIPQKPWSEYGIFSFRGAFVAVGNVMFAIILWALIYQFVFALLNTILGEHFALWRLFL